MGAGMTIDFHSLGKVNRHWVVGHAPAQLIHFFRLPLATKNNNMHPDFTLSLP